MKESKPGFTLGEVLICIVIIGVIMAMSVQSIKIVRASYTSLAYFAFNNLKIMVGELTAGDVPSAKLIDSNGNVLDSALTKCKRADGTIIKVLKIANETIEDEDDIPYCSQRTQNAGGKNIFCESLVAMANTTGKTNCSDFASTTFVDNSATSTTEPAISNYSYDSPNFITTNGQRYYISSWDYNANVSSVYGYRLVAIDLNASSKPNITDSEYTGKGTPDIVTFLVLDNGEVFPLGVAADNLKVGDRIIQYLNSKVKGYYYSYDTSRTEGIPQECSYTTDSGKVSTCNYAVVYVQNDEGKSFFTYREAYCTALGSKTSSYANYCSGITANDLCPYSNNEKAFDLCIYENIKPAFRYNF